jgi:AmiR/NasT family two-component response regulator
LAYVLAGIVALGLTVLFDYSLFKWKEHKELNASWKALNEKLEREGKQRWDKRKI